MGPGTKQFYEVQSSSSPLNYRTAVLFKLGLAVLRLRTAVPYQMEQDCNPNIKRDLRS
ncbi:6462_t:CDS:2 [Funneliformis geosporum]|uniref:6462_t:CDS:1 n=1 Tax=Funneliformis geosporum TaxID=1117311 RepID=A0A9W4SX04_9GLOM|nr:6462_t:CDS:2 [Funneliformis geosporum]